MGFSPALWAFSGGYIIACGAAQAVLGGVTQRSIAITWFERYRGRAMGLVSMALPLGAAMLAVGGQWLLQSGWSWHEVFYGLAALAIVVVLVPVALVLRHSPEAMGLFPDGANAAEHKAGHKIRIANGQSQQEWSVSDAFKTRSLRTLLLASMIAAASNGAIIFYHVAFLVSRGITSLNA